MVRYLGSEHSVIRGLEKAFEKLNIVTGRRQQYSVVCKCNGFEHANEICKKYGLGKLFIRGYYSETGNKERINALKDCDLIISPLSYPRHYVSIDVLLNILKEQDNK